MKIIDSQSATSDKIRSHFARLSPEQRLDLFGLDTPAWSAFQSSKLFALVVGSPSVIEEFRKRADKIGTPLPGIAMSSQSIGSMHISPHGGPLWIEGGGTISGGHTLISLEADADVGIKNMYLHRGGASAYKIGWAYVSALGTKITENNLGDHMESYFR